MSIVVRHRDETFRDPARRRARDLLTGSVAAAAAGEVAGCVVLRGEAGIGKTHLLRSVLGDERGPALIDLDKPASGPTVLSGACSPLGATTPFGPVVDLVEQCLRRLGPQAPDRLDPATWQLLAALDPSRLPPQTPVEHLLPRLGVALTTLLEIALASAGPLAVVVEDLHWADASSLVLLERLARRPLAGLVLVLTWREPFTPATPAALAAPELLRHPDVVDVPLAPLGPDAVAALLRAASTPPPLLQALTRASGGNPYRALQLAAAATSGVVDTRRGPPLPAEGTRARVLAELLAVLGRPVSWRVLEAAMESSAEEVESAADDLAADGFLAVAGGRVGLPHALVADAVLAATGPGRRRSRHQAAARGLRVEGRAATAELARHLAAAGSPEEAALAAEAAADDAQARGALPEALALLRLALEQPLSHPSQLWEKAADLQRWVGGDLTQALGWLEEARAKNGPTHSGEAVRGRLLWSLGDPAGSLAAYRRALGLLPVEAPARERARYLATLGGGLMTLSRHEECLATTSEALGLLGVDLCGLDAGTPLSWPSTREDQLLALHALVSWAVATAESGEEGPALAALRWADATAERLADAPTQVRTAANASYVLGLTGRWADVVDRCERGLADAERIGLDPPVVLVNNRVTALVATGAWHEAADAATAALRGADTDLSLSLHLALADLAAARAEDPAPHLVAVEAIPGAVDDPSLLAHVSAVRAEAALWAGDARGALDTAERVLSRDGVAEAGQDAARLRLLALRALADLAPLIGGAGTGSTRVTHAARVRAHVQRLPAPQGPRAAAVAASADAEACRAMSWCEGAPPPHEAAAAWGRAASAWEDLGEPYPAAYARWRQGEQLLAARRGSAAHPALARAADSARRLRARPLLEAVLLLARQAGWQPQALGANPDPNPNPDPNLDGEAPPPPPDWRLTPRETEVATLLATGCSNRQIARRMGVTEKTVSVHLSNLYAKVGVTNRTQALTVLLRAPLTAAGRHPAFQEGHQE